VVVDEVVDEPSAASGRCLCGSVRYTVRGRLENVVNCHCERCRQFTGHHMAATSARHEDMGIDDADGLLHWFFPVPDAGYAFCSRCGSSLFWQSTSEPSRRSICAGTLDPPTGLTTSQAWWVSQASDYHSRPDIEELTTE